MGWLTHISVLAAALVTLILLGLCVKLPNIASDPYLQALQANVTCTQHITNLTAYVACVQTLNATVDQLVNQVTCFEQAPTDLAFINCVNTNATKFESTVSCGLLILKRLATCNNLTQEILLEACYFRTTHAALAMCQLLPRFEVDATTPQILHRALHLTTHTRLNATLTPILQVTCLSACWQVPPGILREDCETKCLG